MSIKYDGKGLQLPTLAELSKPLTHLDAQHDALEDKVSFIESESAKYDHIVANEPDDSDVVKNYKAFVEGKNKIAEQLNTQGVLSNNMRKNVLSVNTAYNKHILPISIGNERREKQIALENELSIKNPNLLFTRRADTAGLSDFINNTYKTDVLDLNTVMAEGANIGNIFSSLTRGEKVDRSMPGYLKVTKILGFDPVDALVKGDVDLNNLINMYYQKQSSTYNPEIMNTNEKVVKNAFVKGIYSTLKSNDQSQYMSDKQWEVNQQRANIDYQFKKQAEFEAEKQIAAQAAAQAAALNKFTSTKNYAPTSGTIKTLDTKKANALATQLEAGLPKNKNVEEALKISYESDYDFQKRKQSEKPFVRNVDNLRKEVSEVYPQTENWTNEEVVTYLKNTSVRNEMIAQNAYTLTNPTDINTIMAKILPNLAEDNYPKIKDYIEANSKGELIYKKKVSPRITYFGGDVILDFYEGNNKKHSVNITEAFNNIPTHDANGNLIKYFPNQSVLLDNIFKKPLTEENRIKVLEIVAEMRINGLTFLDALTK